MEQQKCCVSSAVYSELHAVNAQRLFKTCLLMTHVIDSWLIINVWYDSMLADVDAARLNKYPQVQPTLATNYPGNMKTLSVAI